MDIYSGAIAATMYYLSKPGNTNISDLQGNFACFIDGLVRYLVTTFVQGASPRSKQPAPPIQRFRYTFFIIFL